MCAAFFAIFPYRYDSVACHYNVGCQYCRHATMKKTTGKLCEEQAQSAGTIEGGGGRLATSWFLQNLESSANVL